jgi:ankyrin repeat protein
MACVDNEGHSPLDWAADFGDVNLIEYLIRKGALHKELLTIYNSCLCAHTYSLALLV